MTAHSEHVGSSSGGGSAKMIVRARSAPVRPWIVDNMLPWKRGAEGADADGKEVAESHMLRGQTAKRTMRLALETVGQREARLKRMQLNRA